MINNTHQHQWKRKTFAGEKEKMKLTATIERNVTEEWIHPPNTNQKPDCLPHTPPGYTNLATLRQCYQYILTGVKVRIMCPYPFKYYYHYFHLYFHSCLSNFGWFKSWLSHPNCAKKQMSMDVTWSDLYVIYVIDVIDVMWNDICDWCDMKWFMWLM